MNREGSFQQSLFYIPDTMGHVDSSDSFACDLRNTKTGQDGTSLLHVPMSQKRSPTYRNADYNSIMVDMELWWFR